MDPLLSSSMQQAAYKYEMPRLELKSLQTFLAIIRCQPTKIRKVIKLAQSSQKVVADMRPQRLSLVIIFDY